jgi:hypothetical protein
MARPRNTGARQSDHTPLGESWMSDRTKNVLILVVVVCLTIVVANLWVGIGPD